jgi:hypothetical protein
MGVMYRYVPALTRRPVPYPRLATAQFAVYAIGTIGMISHFALGRWTGLWWSAGLVLISISLFALNLLPLLWTGLGSGVAETGMFAAICFLLLAASLGVLMGIEEMSGFFWDNLVTNLEGHVSFAAIGWMTLTICAASYRFIPAFILPTEPLPRVARWQILGLVVATAGLGTSLLFEWPGIQRWSLATAVTLLAYVAIMVSLVQTRRMAIDWSLGHALAGVLWLLAAIALSQVVTWFGAWSARGAPYTGALATAALLGWAGNFIIGMSYRLFPGFVVRIRTQLRFPTLSIADISVERPRLFTLLAFNTGVLTIVIAFVSKVPAGGTIGGWFVLGAIAPYVAITFWTLSYAYRRSVPSAARQALRVLPN